MLTKRALLNFVIIIIIACTSSLSCKKEFQNGEVVKPELQSKIDAYLKGPHITIKDFSTLEAKLKAINLGPLASTFRSNVGKETLMNINVPEVYDGFAIIKDSVKVIEGDGHTSYVFQVQLSSPFARSFQNLTIDESKDGVKAFVNTYTPTKRWLAESKSGHPGKFEGDIVITTINLGDKTLLSSLESNPSINSKLDKTLKTSSLIGRPTTSVAEVCTTTTYYYEVAYTCGSGLHLPGEACKLSDGGRAGYASASSIITVCTPVGGGNPGGGSEGGGGGSTTPNVPPGYNPCPTAPPIYSRSAGASGAIFAVRDDTTPCDPAPPVVITTPSELRENKLENALYFDKGILLDCAIAKFFKPLVNFKAPNIVNSRVSTLNSTTSNPSLFTNSFYVQEINKAAGTQINLDRFEVNVGILPVIDGRRLNASEFLQYIRLHLNNFINTEIANFAPYNDSNDYFNDTQNWNSAYPTGSILHLDMADHGSVIVTENTENHWTVSTVRTPLDAQHPVSGNRSWGYSYDNTGYHFYVTGADRLTSPVHDLFNSLTGIPFAKADDLWTSYQNKLSAFINANQGLASIGTSIKERPNFASLKDYFDGKITIEQLKALKACK